MKHPLDDAGFAELLQQARNSPRLRAHRNLHAEHDEPVQRLCIALIHGTYIPPHYHTHVDKWELILVLRGEVMLVNYAADGTVQQKQRLTPAAGVSGVEMQPADWHSLYPLSDEAVIMEIKPGPYTPSASSDFASWAPQEGDSAVNAFLCWQQQAAVGERFEDCSA